MALASTHVCTHVKLARRRRARGFHEVVNPRTILPQSVLRLWIDVSRERWSSGRLAALYTRRRLAETRGTAGAQLIYSTHTRAILCIQLHRSRWPRGKRARVNRRRLGRARAFPASEAGKCSKGEQCPFCQWIHNRYTNRSCEIARGKFFDRSPNSDEIVMLFDMSLIFFSFIGQFLFNICIEYFVCDGSGKIFINICDWE